MCFSIGTKSSTASQVLALYKSNKLVNKASVRKFNWFYAEGNVDSNSTKFKKSYPRGAALMLLEDGFLRGTKTLEYIIDNTRFTIVFSDDEIIQTNSCSGTTRRLFREEVIAKKDMVFQMDIPSLVAQREEDEAEELKAEEDEKIRLENLRLSNLQSIKAPVYESLTWTVESTDVNSPHPFAFAREGQDYLETAFQAFLNGASHMFAFGDYLIDFKIMTQTRWDNGTIRSIYRIDPSSSASSSSA